MQSPRPPKIPSQDLATLLGATKVDVPPSGNVGDLYFVERAGKATAMKVMRPDIPLERSDRELEALERINHPGVVRFLGSGVLRYQGLDYRYIEMERVEGERLANRLAAINAQPLADRVELVLRLLDAADAIDAQHVVHRDIKPDNILIRPDGTPVIVDLGWAKLMDETTITIVGQRTGSLAYNSPEQYRGERVDGRSDLFAMGIIAYKIFIGQHPFWTEKPGDAPDWSAHAQGRPLVGLLKDPEITDEVADTIDLLLEADPANRPASGAVAAENIRAASKGARPPLPVFPRAAFLVNVSFFKKHLENDFFTHVTPDGCVVELRVNPSGTATNHLQRGSLAHRLVDPSSPMSFWAAKDQRRDYKSHMLPSGIDETKLANDQGYADAFVTPFLDLETKLGVTEFISPYVYAATGHLECIDTSVQLAEVAGSKSGGTAVLGGIALEGPILMDSQARQQLVRALTGARVPGFYLLVNDGRSDFRQLDHKDLLIGLRELTRALRRARKALIYGRVGSIGLALLSAGAAGFSSGIEAKGLHYTPEEPKTAEAGGGGPATIERYYVRSLFGFVRSDELRAALVQNDPSTNLPSLTVCDCPFCSANAAMFTSGGTWSPDVAARHMLWSLTMDTHELAALRLGARRAWLRERLVRAAATRDGILRAGIRLELESRTPAFEAWQDVFCSPN